MVPKAHNKTLVITHSLLGGFFTCGLIASLWFISKNVDSYPLPGMSGQAAMVVMAFCFVLSLALIFLFTAKGVAIR
jgi:hypothetical protein